MRTKETAEFAPQKKKRLVYANKQRGCGQLCNNHAYARKIPLYAAQEAAKTEKNTGAVHEHAVAERVLCGCVLFMRYSYKLYMFEQSTSDTSTRRSCSCMILRRTLNTLKIQQWCCRRKALLQYWYTENIYVATNDGNPRIMAAQQ